MKTRMLGLFIMLLVLGAFAQAELTVSDVKLGSSSQDRGVNVSTTVTITNTESQRVNALALSFPNSNVKYKLKGSVPATIEAGASATVTVEGFVTLDLDAVDSKGRKISVDIGDMQVSGTLQDSTPISKTVNVLMEAESKLEIVSDSKIEIEGTSKSLRDGKEYKDVRRDDSAELTVVIGNRFDND
ncbi:MAG: hypothetical protein HGA85_09460, partial [Nanoarchaeota archaeon]|nr:hypothetical protein [Nanoarchaeota archaeon]